MKRLSSTDSLGALISICPTTEQGSPGNNHVYSREFQSMLEGLDEEGCVEEMGQISEKKRRLSINQVKALEKNFEVENKLEPERKVKLAQELGLQPRQIAVWFQNRRARWKTKQLERDYGVLKANYDNLKLKNDTLQQENQSLLKEIRELNSKLEEDNTDKSSEQSVKEEIMVTEDSEKATDQEVVLKSPLVDCEDANTEVNFESFDHQNNDGITMVADLTTFFPDLKDGSSDDSDSSAILNEDNNSPKTAISSYATHGVPIRSRQFMPSSMNCFPFSSTLSKPFLGDAQKAACYQPQVVKNEEHNFLSGDESCNFFSDQDPSLQWYCPDQWN